jgi:hypothetical protein
MTHHNRHPAADRGSVTAYTAIVALAALLFAGLVLDAGLAVATKVHAVSVAQAAARAGAREVDLTQLRRDSVIRLDPPRARQAAQAWLNAAGLPGTVTVAGNQVTVTVTTSRDTQLLQLAGITTIPVQASATATAITPPR